MKVLTTKEDFLSIPIGGKLTLIKDGEQHQFRFAGQHPVNDCDNYFLAIAGSNFLTSKVFRYVPNEKREIWVSDYESIGVGKIMIAQHQEHIEAIEKIYLKTEN